MLNIQKLRCSFDNNTVINDLNLELKRGEIGAVLGSSGCGKSTLLNAIAGFIPPESGSITLEGRPLSTTRDLIPPEHRNIGLVFQDYALFPHLNVSRNIEFGLQKRGRKERSRQRDKMIALADLVGLEKRYPHELSGGQQQRVALARALAPEPTLMLFDEPFSNLDSELRAKIALEVKGLLNNLETTALLVTHDQNEAYAMCDKVGVMHDQRIVQWGEPRALYHTPATPYVAEFIGKGKLIDASVLDHDNVVCEFGRIVLDHAKVDSLKIQQQANQSTKIRLLVRPGDFSVSDQGKKMRISAKVFAGEYTRYQFEAQNGEHYESLMPSSENHNVGDLVPIILKPAEFIAFSAH